MIEIRLPRMAAILAGLLLYTAIPALAAGPTRTWVAKNGNDANPCTIALPCATFQHAHDVTAAGGIVSVLTPGDYGSVTINKSITITNDGAGEAGIQGGGIIVQAGTGDVVGLRGLVIDGGGNNGIGIQYERGSALHIQNCVIRNFTASNVSSFGIFMTNSSGGRLFVSDTLIADITNSSNVGSPGIFIEAHPNGAMAVLNRVRLENNGTALDVSGSFGPAQVILRNSTVSGNAIGIVAGADQGPALVFVKNSSVVNNGIGMFATGAGGTVLLSRTTVARNGTGMTANTGSQFISYSNNEIDANDNFDGTPTGYRTLR